MVWAHGEKRFITHLLKRRFCIERVNQPWEGMAGSRPVGESQSPGHPGGAEIRQGEKKLRFQEPCASSPNWDGHPVAPPPRPPVRGDNEGVVVQGF